MSSLHIHLPHPHVPHVPYSFSLMGMILGVIVVPPLIIFCLFVVTQLLLGGWGLHNVH